MAKQSGLGAGLYVAGYEVSNDTKDVSQINGGPTPLDKTGIDRLAFERRGGVRSGGIATTSHFNPDADRAHAVLSTLPNTDRSVMFRLGNALGGPAACLSAKQINYDGNRAADGDFTMPAQYLSNGTGLEWCDMLTPGTRTDAAATNGGSVDFGAATAFGLQAYLQVVAFSGTNVTITIEDSTDDVAFAALADGAFAQVTAAHAHERIVTARNATVRRYLRVATAGVFASVSFIVAVAKNEVEVRL